jgi:hypothetical protein
MVFALGQEESRDQLNQDEGLRVASTLTEKSHLELKPREGCPNTIYLNCQMFDKNY